MPCTFPLPSLVALVGARWLLLTADLSRAFYLHEHKPLSWRRCGVPVILRAHPAQYA